MRLSIIVVLVALAGGARAEGGCLFDGACSSRSPVTIESPIPVDLIEKRERPIGRWEGLKKGGQEGYLYGFYGTLSPAIEMMDKGFSERMTAHSDGRGNAQRGSARQGLGYGLGLLLLIPAMIGGAIAAVVGGAWGAADPEKAAGWDAEKWMFD